MATGNDHLEMVYNARGEKRPRPGKEKEKAHFFINSTVFLPKSALGFDPWDFQTPDLINLISSKTVFFYFAVTYCIMNTLQILNRI